RGLELRIQELQAEQPPAAQAQPVPGQRERRIHPQLIEAVAAQGGKSARAQLALQFRAFLAQRGKLRELTPDLRREQDALLVEQLVTFAHQLLLILQFEARDARRGELERRLRHERGRSGNVQSAARSGARVPPPEGRGAAASRAPCFPPGSAALPDEPGAVRTRRR